MELRITRKSGQIGIESRDAVLSIRQPRSELALEAGKTELNIRTNHIKIKIDQSQCFSEAGLKRVSELQREYARIGREAAIAAIANITDEGNRLSMIENKSDAVVEIATGKNLPPPDEFNITLMPQSRPRIEFEGGVTFNPVSGKNFVNIETYRPEINVTPGNINIYMLREPYFNVEFLGNNVDISG